MSKSGRGKGNARIGAPTLNTLAEVEENQSRSNQIEELFNSKISFDSSKQNNRANSLEINPIIPERASLSNSTQTNSTRQSISIQKRKSIKSKQLNDSCTSDTTSVSLNIEDLNNPNESQTSSITNDKNSSVTSVNTGSLDYDKIIKKQCGDLTMLTYANNVEKYLITRIYCNLNKLNTIISDMNQINLKFYLNTPDENDCLPLYYAIKADCLNTVKLLINKGAPVDKTTVAGDPAVHLACLLGVSIELINFLITMEEAYDKVSNIYKTDQEGWTVLHCACNQGHLEVVRYLLEQKHMNPNYKDGKNRYTGLQLATINNRINIVEYFLSFPSIKSVGRGTTPKPPVIVAPTNTNEPETNQNNSDKTSLNQLNLTSAKLNNSIGSITSRKNSAHNNSNISLIIKSAQVLRNKSNTKSNKVNLNLIPEAPASISENIQKLRKREKISIESMNVYYQIESCRLNQDTLVYSNLLIDLNSQNSEGQTVLHLACRYGLYPIVNLLLKKYGSNEINVNMVDFKGRTCLDLAWMWLLNMDCFDESQINEDSLKEENEKVSFFIETESSFYVQRNMLIINKRIDSEIKLIHLLNQYGAKFSNHKYLLYDKEILKELDDDDIHLTSNLFYPKDHVSFYNLKLQSNNITPIMTYLKLASYLFKLNLPTMFLTSNYKNKGVYRRLEEGTQPVSCSTKSYYSENILNRSNNTISEITQQIKKDFAQNLHDLISYIQKNAIDSFEKQYYYEIIESLFDLISKY